MEDVEQRALATSPVKPFFWKRYVNDVISAVSVNELERLLSPSIQFTLREFRHVSIVNLPTPTNTLLLVLTALFAIKSP